LLIHDDEVAAPLFTSGDWLGSRAVAQEHYLQVTDAHFHQAVTSAIPGGAAIPWSVPLARAAFGTVGKPKSGASRYRKRYIELARQLARASGLHPIRDRAVIQALMLQVLAQARRLKQQCPMIKRRHDSLPLKSRGNRRAR